MEITSRCQVACPMCARNLHGGRTRDNIAESDMNLADFTRWFDDAFLAQLSQILLCGNFGDPIIGRDCLPIIDHIRSVAPGAEILINTNGSARPPDFWEALARYGVRVTFAIDGATDASHGRYRRGASLSRVLQNARIFTRAGGHGVCDMLVFQHNRDEVEAVRKLVTDAGLQTMVVKTTNRFHGSDFAVLDAAERVIDRLEPVERAPQTMRNRAFQLKTCRIECRTESEKSIYVSADGYVFPCCWLAQLLPERPHAPDSQYARQFPGRQPNHRLDSFFAALDAIGAANLHLERRSLARILDRTLPAFAAYREVDQSRIHTCAATCGVGIGDRVGGMYSARYDLRTSS